MRQAKYRDPVTGRHVDGDNDGCPLHEWEARHGAAPFAVHQHGFKVFLPPSELASSDEYAASDPYSVKDNLHNEFHARRCSETIDLVKSAIGMAPAASEILDLGCGEGHITEQVRQAVPGPHYTGLDYSLSAINYARQCFPAIEFDVGDGYATPYQDQFFDLVICNNLWEHVPDPLRLLAEIRRVLKTDGYVIISTPSRYRLGNLVRVARGKPVGFLSAQHVTEYSVGQVLEQLRYGGFNTVHVRSKPISTGSTRAWMARYLVQRLIRVVGSHHQLESTVFYMAQKVRPSIE